MKIPCLWRSDRLALPLGFNWACLDGKALANRGALETICPTAQSDADFFSGLLEGTDDSGAATGLQSRTSLMAEPPQ